MLIIEQEFAFILWKNQKETIPLSRDFSLADLMPLVLSPLVSHGLGYWGLGDIH